MSVRPEESGFPHPISNQSHQVLCAHSLVFELVIGSIGIDNDVLHTGTGQLLLQKQVVQDRGRFIPTLELPRAPQIPKPLGDWALLSQGEEGQLNPSYRPRFT